MNIEEKAKDFAPDCKNPNWKIGMDQEAFVTLQRICFKKGYLAALTSLLEELPPTGHGIISKEIQVGC